LRERFALPGADRAAGRPARGGRREEGHEGKQKVGRARRGGDAARTRTAGSPRTRGKRGVDCAPSARAGAPLRWEPAKSAASPIGSTSVRERKGEQGSKLP